MKEYSLYMRIREYISVKYLRMEPNYMTYLKRERRMRRQLIMHLTALLLSALILISTLVMIVPAAGDSNHSNQSDSVIFLLEQLAGNVSMLSYENFSHPNKKAAEGQRGALCNKIRAVINQVKAGAYGGAVDKLRNDIQKKIEKWIVNDEAQYLIKQVDIINECIRQPWWPKIGWIEGRVTDAKTCSAIVGATVKADGYFAVTNASGYYIIKVPAPATYTVTAEMDQYYTETACGVYVGVCETVTVNFALVPIPHEGWINGTVIDTGTTLPIKGANVTAGGYSTLTAEDGTYEIQVYAPAVYNVKASAEGYYIQIVNNVFVDKQATVTVDFALCPIQPPVVIPSRPLASFTWSPPKPVANETVTFDATSSTPNGGEIIRYAWNLGDNTVRFGDIVTHAYAREGTYTVVLNVTDSEGLWDTDTVNITVYFVPVDTEPPTIVEVLRCPPTPNYNEAVTVIANVTDDVGSGIESVILYYSTDAITWINTTMSPVCNDLYSAKIQPKPYNTVVVYYIYASDKVGNTATSRPFFYRVADLLPPVISDVEHLPTSPNYIETVTVSTSVTEPPEASGVGFVILSYGDGSVWTNVTMTLVGTRFSAMIPILPYGTEVQYRVYASDNAWNWAVSDIHFYQVTDNIPPSIGAPTWDPVEPLAEGQVNVTVSVSEPLGASGVKNVTLWHNATGEWQPIGMTPTNGNWTATIPGASGGVTVAFYVESYDNAGNRAVTTTYDYKVKKVAVVWPLAWLAAIGLGIAALTATLLYALYRRRKKGRSAAAANLGNKVKPNPVVTLYVPAKILS
ncbi:MAG: PKD domain protein [Candidatus Bathyarchaeota archaeon BA2]|nr:MAG: PKD domain protein [Candidatus Bathyarchaeota archaeon BA2]